MDFLLRAHLAQMESGINLGLDFFKARIHVASYSSICEIHKLCNDDFLCSDDHVVEFD
jgi:hypothetical protein